MRNHRKRRRVDITNERGQGGGSWRDSSEHHSFGGDRVTAASDTRPPPLVPAKCGRGGGSHESGFVPLPTQREQRPLTSPLGGPVCLHMCDHLLRNMVELSCSLIAYSGHMADCYLPLSPTFLSFFLLFFLPQIFTHIIEVILGAGRR